MTDCEDKPLKSELKRKALDLLSRREHSIYELVEKLRRHAPDTEKELFDELVSELIALGYLSEPRYAEMLIRSRVSKGYGPSRVRQELQQKRVSRELISLSLEACDVDWFELAKEVRERRFGLSEFEGDQKLRAKQQRFLFSRGFSSDQVQYAMSCEE